MDGLAVWPTWAAQKKKMVDDLEVIETLEEAGIIVPDERARKEHPRLSLTRYERIVCMSLFQH